MLALHLLFQPFFGQHICVDGWVWTVFFEWRCLSDVFCLTVYEPYPSKSSSICECCFNFRLAISLQNKFPILRWPFFVVLGLLGPIMSRWLSTDINPALKCQHVGGNLGMEYHLSCLSETQDAEEKTLLAFSNS